MPHLCPVCQKEEWHPLDSIVITCPKCIGQKSLKTGPDTTIPCDLCQGHGRLNFEMRSQRYWYDQNVLYDEQVGMKVCKSCGFVTYSPRWPEEKLREYYTQERKSVNAGLIIRSNVKNLFHKFFLGIDDADVPEIKGLRIKSVLDVGCAFGHVRNLFKNADIYGIEYSKSLCKYAREVNNIKLVNDIKDIPDKSVDLVMIYHTLEHTSDPRATLADAKRVLRDGGYLYVAVPDYLGTLREVSNMACLDFEKLYHLNHNNVFSHTSFNNLLRQCGFEVVKMDNAYYGEAVLCKVNDAVDKAITVEDWAAIENKLYKQKMAMDILSKSYRNQDTDKAVMGIEAALAQYPAYVDAYEALMVQKNVYKSAAAVEGIFERAVAAGADNLHLRARYATILLNWADAGQVNNYVKRAVDLFESILQVFPFEQDSLIMLCKIYAYNFKDFAKAEEYGKQAVELNPTQWGEITNVLSHVRCLE